MKNRIKLLKGIGIFAILASTICLLTYFCYLFLTEITVKLFTLLGIYEANYLWPEVPTLCFFVILSLLIGQFLNYKLYKQYLKDKFLYLTSSAIILYFVLNFTIAFLCMIFNWGIPSWIIH
jgi:hypothetical protein